jgi:hypothetical protein
VSPPVSRPYPRFIADAAQEGRPYGRWGERLGGDFERACRTLAEEAGVALVPDSLQWFPDRSWGGRVYVPVTGRGAESEGGGRVEYFGHVSFVHPEGGEPRDLRARADFTDVVAEDNPEWRIDLNDDVIGAWRTDGGRGGDVTLVWGVPLVRGAVAATAELDEEVIDQAAVDDGRFTLVAVDAVKGFGDDMFLAVRLWDRRVRELAAESLYDEPDSGPDSSAG